MAVQILPAFTPDGSIGAAFGPASSRIALPGTTVNSDFLVVVTNFGSVPVYVVLGDNTVVAAVGTSLLVMAGQTRVIARGTATYLAGIVAGGLSSPNYNQNGLVAVDTGN